MMPSRTLWACLGALACAPEPYGTGPEVFAEPTVHIGDSWLFSSGRINRIDIQLDDAAIEILRSERNFSYPRTKVRAQSTLDGESAGVVGVRLRGGLGSFNSIDDKPKLELDFNEFDDTRFHGLESLSLNSMIADCSGLREAIALAAYGKMGLPTSRTGYAQLFINGDDYGMYLVVETQDDRWLRRRFADGEGNLYDGKYVYSGYFPNVVDFGTQMDHWFDLEEGEDVGFADIGLISRGVEKALDQGRIDDTLWARVDWEAFVSLLRVEQWTLNDDAYAMAPNNYRVYFEPGRPMVVIPWDTDSSFPVQQAENGSGMTVHQAGTGDSSWADPDGNLARVCMDDPTCRSWWKDMGPESRSLLMDGALLELGETLHALTAEGMRGDPRRRGDGLRDTCDGGSTAQAEAVLRYVETGQAPSKSGCSHGGTSQRRGLVIALVLVGMLSGRRRRGGALPSTSQCL